MARRKANRRHKDTVFRDIFGSEERKRYTLSLYNALGNKGCTDSSAITLNSLDNVLYMGVRNDVSFLVGGELALWEHQSTYNPNMPLRVLRYLVRVYERMLEAREEDEYSPRLIRLPAPKASVFYIGERERPDVEVMRLSNAYAVGGDAEILVTCYNINNGHNRELMERCKALRGYSLFVDGVRKRLRGGVPLADAVAASVDACIDGGILTEYFKERRSEVADIFMTEYDEAKVLERVGKASYRHGREDGYGEGRSVGYGEGRQGMMADNLRALTEGHMSLDAAMRLLRVPESEQPRYRELLGQLP